MSRDVFNSADNEIYVANLDGTMTMSLTPDMPAGIEAGGRRAWSPVDDMIAFHAEGDIFIMKPDGSDKTRLTDESSTDSSPIWSPDGTKILYSSVIGTNQHISVINRDGSGRRNLTSTEGLDTCPSWSPDGEHITFESTRDDVENQFQLSDIYVMDADGSNQTRLSSGPLRELRPDWSPGPIN